MTEACSEYRDSLRLLALRLRLTEDDLGADERQNLEAEVAVLENRLEMD